MYLQDGLAGALLGGLLVLADDGGGVLAHRHRKLDLLVLQLLHFTFRLYKMLC